MEIVDILIKNANEIISLKGPNRPRTKKEMNDLKIIKNGSIAIKDGKIFDIGKNLKYKSKKTIDAKGKTVLPGFVDPHTHLVFAGSREFELDWKLKGFSYLDIKKKGGGISYTVKQTRKASENELFNGAKKRLDKMLSYGTTTCEAKSGYGLNTESELKILKVQKKLKEKHKIDIVSTFLGAHAIPKEQSASEYINTVVDEMLPKVKKYAKFCDVFCEKGFFTYDQSKRILESGLKNGLKPKIHAARKMIDAGVAIALATDLNPNCYVENMQFMIQLACFNMKMTPAEAICAATFNAACAIDKNNEIGSLETGKKADILIMDCSNHLQIPYHFGINHVINVIKKGIVLI